MLDDLSFLPRLGGGRSSSPKKRRTSSKSGGSTVVEGPWGASAPPAGLSPIEQLELDQLLDKTSAQGLDSLSRTEKNRLNELSKKLRSR